MDDQKPKGVGSEAVSPITEADLHAYVDGQLSPERCALVEQFLAARPNEHERVRDWQHQNVLLHELLDPVVDEALPIGLPLKSAKTAFAWRSLAAGLLVAILSGGSAWSLRGHLDGDVARLASISEHGATSYAPALNDGKLTGFAYRAAVAHVVYSPDMRRPVEVGADQEQALVTWLTKRMGTAVRAPSLAGLGYKLIGGRLLPGDKGPVAQFMYGTADGQRLTLYVTHEDPLRDSETFKFGTDGPVNVFYWVENHFGYAISAGADRTELLKVSQEIYRQLKPE